MPWERIGFYVTCLILPVPLVFLASSVTSHLGQSDRRIWRKLARPRPICSPQSRVVRSDK
jgi:hypothetical protein